MTSRVSAIIQGGSADDGHRLQSALDQLYNSETITGHVQLLAVFTKDRKWRIEVAHMYGTGALVRVEAPRGIPTDIRVQVMTELKARGFPIDGVL